MQAPKPRLLGILVAIAVCLGIAAFLWASFRQGASPQVSPTATDAQEQPAAPVTKAADVSAAVTDASAADTATAEVEPERSAVAVGNAARPKATVRGRAVDAHGAPLAACTVKLHGWQANSQRMDAWLAENAAQPEWQDPETLTTGDDGSFSFTFWPPPPFQFTLDVTSAQHGSMGARWSELAEGSHTDVGDVVMVTGVRVTGRVVDPSGMPLERVYVTLNMDGRQVSMRGQVAPQWGEQTVSKADGSFAFRSVLHPGAYGVHTQDYDLQSPKAVELTAEQPTVDLVIVAAKPAPTMTITGRVIDETGAPAVGVRVESHTDGWSSATTRKSGTFELRKREPGGSQKATLHLYSDLYELSDVEPREVDWGARDIEFTVTRAPSLTVRVTDSEQQPVDTYTVYLIPQNRGRMSSEDSRARAQGQHENGTVVIPGLTRGDWLLRVTFPAASGLQELSESFRHDVSAPRRIDLRAVPPSRRTLRVLDAEGTPVADTKVQLCDPFDAPFDETRNVMSRSNWDINGGPRRSALVLQEGETDANGRFELRGPAGRDLGICVLGPGHVPCRQAGVRLEVDEELVVRVSLGARLVGKIVPAEAIAELLRLVHRTQDSGFAGDKRPRLAFDGGQGRRFPSDHRTAVNLECLRVANDGTFDVTGVPAGFWKLEVSFLKLDTSGAGGSRNVGAGEVTLTDSKTTEHDIDLSHILPGTIDGLVLLNGVPAANESVGLQGAHDWEMLKTDGKGRFEVQCTPGDYTVQVARKRGADGWTSLRCTTPARVVRGAKTTQTFMINTSTLHIRVLNHEGKPVTGVVVHAVCGEVSDGLPATDAEGNSKSEVTTQTVTLRLLPKELSSPEAMNKAWMEGRARGETDPLASRWIVLQEVALRAGQATELEHRLPQSSGY